MKKTPKPLTRAIAYPLPVTQKKLLQLYFDDACLSNSFYFMAFISVHTEKLSSMITVLGSLVGNMSWLCGCRGLQSFFLGLELKFCHLGIEEKSQVFLPLLAPLRSEDIKNRLGCSHCFVYTLLHHITLQPGPGPIRFLP